MRIGHTGLVWPIAVLAVVLVVLILVLIVLILIVILAVLLLILVLVFHFYILQIFVLRLGRYSSIPRISGFILGLEDQTDQKPAENGRSDAAGGGLKPTG